MKNLLLISVILLIHLSVRSQAPVIIKDSAFKFSGFNTSYSIRDVKIEGDMLTLRISVPMVTPIEYIERKKILYAIKRKEKGLQNQILLRLYVSGDPRDFLSSVDAIHDLAFNIKPLRQKGSDKILLSLERWEGQLVYRY